MVCWFMVLTSRGRVGRGLWAPALAGLGLCGHPRYNVLVLVVLDFVVLALVNERDRLAGPDSVGTLQAYGDNGEAFVVTAVRVKLAG
jgi:hypothetical protein